MKILRPSARGPSVELLQLGLSRAGFYTGGLDGIFGPATLSALKRFQSTQGLVVDGVVGSRTWEALSPWLYGYRRVRVRRGDTLWRLARENGGTLAAVEAANPDLDPFNLQLGSSVIVPLDFPLVPDNIRFTSELLDFCVAGLQARYPFIKTGTIGTSVMGKPLHLLRLGHGANQVFYNAAHHANEWITTPLLLLFAEAYCTAYLRGGSVGGLDAAQIFESSTIWLVPMVNPDGVDLVTGLLDSGTYFARARGFAENYPAIAFPSGWKANLNGVDLNLQYPAGWENAKEIKFSQGYTRPGPRDYVGTAPLTEPESRAVAAFTRGKDFSLTLSYHSQGQVIYWKYLDFEPAQSREIAERFGALSGYTVESTPYASGFAGYKDWFIQEYDRPGYTIEVGLGENPLPITQLPEIYENNLGILAYAAVATL